MGTHHADARLLTQSVAVTGTSTLTATNGYDPDANPITATLQAASPGSSVQTTTDTSTYNAADWQTSRTDNGLTTTYGYDAADRTTAITVTDNGVSTVEPITHAAAGWITGWVGPSPNGAQTWAYNGDGNVISTTSYINGGINTTVYTYSLTQPNELVQQHTDSLGEAGESIGRHVRQAQAGARSLVPGLAASAARAVP